MDGPWNTVGAVTTKQPDRALGEWLDRLLLERYATKGDLAKAAGISPSAFWRQVVDGKLGLKPLLRLALDTGESPSDVLRLAGKGDEAALIERCYGPPRVIARPDVRAVAELLEGRSAAYVKSLLGLLKDMPPAPPPTGGASTTSEAGVAKPGTPRSRGAQGRKRRGDAKT